MEIQNRRVIPKPVFAEIPDKYQLSDEQLRFYRDNGFLVIKQLIDFGSLYSFKCGSHTHVWEPSTHLDIYRQRFLQIAKGIVPRGNMTVMREPSLVGKKMDPEDYINKIQEILYDDVFIQYALHPQLYHVVSQLIGDDVTAIHSMFINKPPGTGRHPPHQDLYYFPYRPADKIVASWSAVDHVTTDNGCLYVVPGSHKPALIYPHGNLQGSNKLYHGILAEEEVAPEDKRVYVEMSPGDTVFFHPCLVHGSGPNISTNYRKAITFHFANSECECIDVTGTVQQDAAAEIEAEAKRRYQIDLAFADIWKMKSRRITGLKSHL